MDSEVVHVEITAIEPGERLEPIEHPVAFGGVDPVSLHQRRRVLPDGELLGLVEHLSQRPRLALIIEAVVVPGGGCVRGEVEREREVVAGVEHTGPLLGGDGLEVESDGDEDDPVELDTLLREQLVGDRRPPGSAVALAGQVLGRGPAPIPIQVGDDELGEGVYVSGEVVVLALFVLGRGGAEAGADRIDQDHVGHVEHRVLVVD